MYTVSLQNPLTNSWIFLKSKQTRISVCLKEEKRFCQKSYKNLGNTFILIAFILPANDNDYIPILVSKIQ